MCPGREQYLNLIFLFLSLFYCYSMALNAILSILSLIEPCRTVIAGFDTMRRALSALSGPQSEQTATADRPSHWHAARSLSLAA